MITTKSKKKPEYIYKGVKYKSTIEQYFAMYLTQLLALGYVKEWGYEQYTFGLTAPYSRSYLKQLKTKVKEESESLLEKSSITADFHIIWDISAENIFYLNPSKPINKPVKSIPFRLCAEKSYILNPMSLIETKGFNLSNVSSNISFPYKQKFLLKQEGLYIQKIHPFSYKTNRTTLFKSTFYPDDVLKSEIYVRDCKWGKKGESKIKHKYKTINNFLNI